MRFWIFVFFIIVLASPVFGVSGHTTLLTVAEADNVSIGGTADLFLEIRPGTGRVFIDSFPLTRLDTQITTRYSKEVACNFVDIDCNKLDFFYTIRAQTSLIGGPSAGAAKTLLTASLLEGVPLSDKVVMTGTINSGGVIGPVSGISAKAEAARDAGFDTVIVPRWASEVRDLEVEGINVVPVSTLEEALFVFTGVDYTREFRELHIPESYQNIMGEIANDLCERTLMLSEDSDLNVSDNIRRAADSFSRGDYYSSASFCFSSNVELRAEMFSDYSEDELESIKNELLFKIREHELFVDSIPLDTMSDLEASIVVKERLLDARNSLDDLSTVGYAYERFESALAWSNFFDFEGEAIDLDPNFLSHVCLSKIAEVEERLNYLEFMSNIVQDRESVRELRNIHRNEDFAFCIFRGTRIKADINAGLLASSVDSDLLEELAEDKNRLAYNQISHQKQYFPILGYSYYIYATSLVEDNPRLSVVFSEYALEFGNLDIYLQGRKGIPFSFWVSEINTPTFYLGLSVGAGIILFIVLISLRRKKDFKPRKISRRNPPGKKR